MNQFPFPAHNNVIYETLSERSPALKGVPSISGFIYGIAPQRHQQARLLAREILVVVCLLCFTPRCRGLSRNRRRRVILHRIRRWGCDALRRLRWHWWRRRFSQPLTMMGPSSWLRRLLFLLLVMWRLGEELLALFYRYRAPVDIYNIPWISQFIFMPFSCFQGCNRFIVALISFLLIQTSGRKCHLLEHTKFEIFQ
jgi:hypothetical protein